MNPSLLMIGSFGVLALALVVTLVAVLREKRALGRLVESAVDFDAAKDAITHLPAPHQEIAAQMVDAINVRSTLDEALTKAVVRTTNESFEPPLARRLILIGVFAIAVFGPISLALVQAANQIVVTYNDSRERPIAMVYLEGQSKLEAPFTTLHSVFSTGAWLLAALMTVWALRWWLLRPEIREARFIRALLESATRLRPGVPAPISARLSEIVAPERGLGRPVAASIIWFLAVTTGWLLLYGTATVKAANSAEPMFEVWPKTKPIAKPDDLVLPNDRAGRPLQDVARPSIFIEPRGVRIPPRLIAEIDANGALTPEWAARAPNLTEVFKRYAPLEPMVLAHGATSMRTFLALLREMDARYGGKLFHLVIERAARSERSRGKLQAELPMRLGPTGGTPGLVIHITQRGVRIVQENVELPFSDPAWPRRLRDAVRVRRELYELDLKSPLEIHTSLRINYQRFIEVVGAADTACMGTVDCGLPGLGLELVVVPLDN